MSTPLTKAEFAAIAAAVMETDKGRRFLVDFARRQRAEDVARILAALERIEARALQGEVERARRRLESERTGEIVDQRADARARAGILSAREEVEPPRPRKGGLEHRFAALVQLDEQDLESGFTRFG